MPRAGGRCLDVVRLLRITTRALFSVDISREAESLGHRIAEGLGYLISPDTPEFLRGRAGVEEIVGIADFNLMD